MLPVESRSEPKRRRDARKLERNTDDGSVRKNVESATIIVPGIRPLQSEGTGKHVLFAHGPVRGLSKKVWGVRTFGVRMTDECSHSLDYVCIGLGRSCLSSPSTYVVTWSQSSRRRAYRSAFSFSIFSRERV